MECNSYLDSGDMVGYAACLDYVSVPLPPGLSKCVQDCMVQSSDMRNSLATCEALCGEIGPPVDNGDGPIWTATGTAKADGFPWLLLLLLLVMLYYATKKG